jgi:alcohol dehydrogenase class IV
MTPDVRIGCGVVSQLAEVLGQDQRVLVVHGRNSFRAGPAAAAVDGLAAEVRYYAGVRPNPALQQVREAVALAREYAPDAVVGIGGGSAMDVAKCVAVLGGFADDPLPYLLGSPAIPDRRSVRLVQVPTIAGSGSELTCFATVYVGHRKLSLDHPSAAADHVLIDPDLASTVPMPTAAASALDALAQAVESAWAVAATSESRDLAVRALETLTSVLAAATSRGSFTEPSLRTELARGAALAGAAINTSRTTAAHALSYSLTAGYGIAHGAAVGLHLRWLIGHNSAVTAADVRHPDGADAVRRLIDRLQRICLDGAGMPLETMIDRLLAMHGADGFQLPHRDWHEDLSGGRALNNPRLVSHEDVLRNTSGPRRPAGSAPSPRRPRYTQEAI